MAQAVTKSVKYKSVRWAGGTRANLFTRLSAALKQFPAIGSRLHSLPPDQKTQRAINHHRAVSGGVGGSLIEWTNGDGAALIDDFDPTADELDISTLPTNDRRKFLQAMAFFYIRNNHLVLIASPVLTERRVEEYLNWILSRSNPNTPPLSLADVTPPNSRARGALRGVRTVSIDPTPLLHDAGDRRIGTALRGSLVRDLLDRLREAGGRGIHPASIEQALASENVRASIEIRYSGRMPPDGVPLLNQLAGLVAEVTDEGYKINVDGKGLLTPSDFRIRDSRRIASHDGYPHVGHAVESMADWLDELQGNGTVVD